MERKPRAKARRGAHQGMPDELLEAVAARFRALGVPSRLRVLNVLMNGPLTMGELGEETGLEQSNLSRHVTELERAGCVARAKVGRSVQVELADPTLRELCELVCGSLKDRASKTHAALRGH